MFIIEMFARGYPPKYRSATAPPHHHDRYIMVEIAVFAAIQHQLAWGLSLLEGIEARRFLMPANPTFTFLISKFEHLSHVSSIQ